jgi:hypothetical protein
MGLMTRPLPRTAQGPRQIKGAGSSGAGRIDPHYPETATSRREFLGSFLGALVFWRSRDRRTLAGIEFQRLRNERHSPRRYLLIHGNEQTAREVLTKHLETAQGTAWLVRNTTRNVAIGAGVIDPNRMFSRDGAERNLRTLNPDWSEAQIENGLLFLDRKRGQVLDAVRPGHGDVLIAMHNNSESYSVKDEVTASDRTALNDAANPHEFCLCTDAGDFDRLAHGPYNVVLQNHPAGVDDGSLSRYAARRGFRYVNIEAGLGRFEKQKAMLDWLDGALPRAR